jgi:hypothetical protein
VVLALREAGGRAPIRTSETLSRPRYPIPVFLLVARFSLRRSLRVFCGCFFCSFFGFSEPFIADLLAEA